MKKRVILSAVLLIACDHDITDSECARRFACEVEGIDLAVVSAQPDSAELELIRYRVDASNVKIKFVVVNRGDTPATGQRDVVVSFYDASTTVSIPALAPGDSAVGIARLVIDRAFLYSDEDLRDSRARVTVLSDDVEATNNEITTPRLRLNIPFVALVTELDTPQIARINNTVFGVRYRVLEDRSGVSVLFCLRSGTRTCTPGNWPATSRSDNPSPSGGSTFLIPGPNPPAGQYEIMVCLVPRSHSTVFVDLADPDHHCKPAGLVTIVP